MPPLCSPGFRGFWWRRSSVVGALRRDHAHKTRRNRFSAFHVLRNGRAVRLAPANFIAALAITHTPPPSSRFRFFAAGSALSLSSLSSPSLSSLPSPGRSRTDQSMVIASGAAPSAMELGRVPRRMMMMEWWHFLSAFSMIILTVRLAGAVRSVWTWKTSPPLTHVRAPARVQAGGLFSSYGPCEDSGNEFLT